MWTFWSREGLPGEGEQRRARKGSETSGTCVCAVSIPLTEMNADTENTQDALDLDSAGPVTGQGSRAGKGPYCPLRLHRKQTNTSGIHSVPGRTPCAAEPARLCPAQGSQASPALVRPGVLQLTALSPWKKGPSPGTVSLCMASGLPCPSPHSVLHRKVKVCVTGLAPQGPAASPDPVSCAHPTPAEALCRAQHDHFRPTPQVCSGTHLLPG